MIAVIAASGALVLAGCTPQNHRNRLGNLVDLAAFERDGGSVPGLFSVEGPVSRGARTETVDRQEWPAHAFYVPVDGTVFGPQLVDRVDLTDYVDPDHRMRRRHGLYPTAASALDVKGERTWPVVVEGPVAPVVAATDFLLLPVRSALAPPWVDDWNNRPVYKRTEQSGWYAAPAEGPPPAEDARGGERERDD